MPAICPNSAQAKSRTGSRLAGWIELHLGTRVQISFSHSGGTEAEAIIASAFAEIGLIHRLMSFHDGDSDIARLNRGANEGAVQVDPRTVQVLGAAIAMSSASNGLFDVTIAPELVRTGGLPQSACAAVPDPAASWRDIEIESDSTVRFHRPLLIDVGGIAKGYAVDRAYAICEAAGVDDCVINAGGDIRVGQGTGQLVTLDVPRHESHQPREESHQNPCVELTGGSIASSYCDGGEPGASDTAIVHINGITRSPAAIRRFASVLAESCMTADALTKSVMLLGQDAAPLLERYEASALIHEPAAGWLELPVRASAYSNPLTAAQLS